MKETKIKMTASAMKKHLKSRLYSNQSYRLNCDLRDDTWNLLGFVRTNLHDNRDLTIITDAIREELNSSPDCNHDKIVVDVLHEIVHCDDKYGIAFSNKSAICNFVDTRYNRYRRS